ncbi:MAG: L-lactate dehydrogenase [Clostridia bacterium]|nr:L-lactate dehydrogenase [Clostridia bacterium]
MISEKELELLCTERAVIIGSGNVGSTIAYTLAVKGLFEDIGIIDLDRDKAEGDAMDISHGVSFVKPTSIVSGGYDLCKNADIVIITAGANQKPGETRLDLLKRNIAVFKSITDNMKQKVTGEPIVLVVSNPVDVLTYVTSKLLGYKKGRVLGSGTVLDTSRMKYLLGKYTKIDTRNIHTYIIGEHGDSEVAAWSATSIAGLTPEEFKNGVGGKLEGDIYEIPRLVKEAAYEVIDKKGATYYAIALAVERICEAIFRDERSILTVSAVLDGEYGANDVAMSVPCIVGGNGVEGVIEVPFSTDEKAGLTKSAEIMSGLLREAGF